MFIVHDSGHHEMPWIIYSEIVPDLITIAGKGLGPRSSGRFLKSHVSGVDRKQPGWCSVHGKRHWSRPPGRTKAPRRNIIFFCREFTRLLVVNNTISPGCCSGRRCTPIKIDPHFTRDAVYTGKKKKKKKKQISAQPARRPKRAWLAYLTLSSHGFSTRSSRGGI